MDKAVAFHRIFCLGEKRMLYANAFSSLFVCFIVTSCVRYYVVTNGMQLNSSLEQLSVINVTYFKHEPCTHPLGMRECNEFFR